MLIGRLVHLFKDDLLQHGSLAGKRTDGFSSVALALVCIEIEASHLSVLLFDCQAAGAGCAQEGALRTFRLCNTSHLITLLLIGYSL